MVGENGRRVGERGLHCAESRAEREGRGERGEEEREQGEGEEERRKERGVDGCHI